MIPISLFVTAEMIKFFIAWFMERDLEMYDEKKD